VSTTEELLDRKVVATEFLNNNNNNVIKFYIYLIAGSGTLLQLDNQQE
jgi:hypothetical protein